jgi:hypothetical protein
MERVSGLPAEGPGTESNTMECRWVVGITLWTVLSGPVFVGLSVPPSLPQAQNIGYAAKMPPSTPPVANHTR